MPIMGKIRLPLTRCNGEEHRLSKLTINLNHEKHEKHESGVVENLIFVDFVPFVVTL